MVILINKLIKPVVLGCFVAHLFICLGLCTALGLGRFEGMMFSLLSGLGKKSRLTKMDPSSV